VVPFGCHGAYHLATVVAVVAVVAVSAVAALAAALESAVVVDFAEDSSEPCSVVPTLDFDSEDFLLPYRQRSEEP
jgi:hypothetical protein